VAPKTAILAGLILGCAADLGAQPQPKGLIPEWEAAPKLKKLATRIRGLTEFTGRVDLAKLEANGAPAALLAKWKDIPARIEYLAASLEALANNPYRLPNAFEAGLTAQSVDASIESMIEGTRYYQSPPAADLIRDLLSDRVPIGAEIREYVAEVMAGREQELVTLGKDVQKVRENLTRPAQKK